MPEPLIWLAVWCGVALTTYGFFTMHPFLGILWHAGWNVWCLYLVTDKLRGSSDG